MPSYLALVQLKDDTALPENFCVNTLAFDDAGATSDPNNLASDLVAIYQGLSTDMLAGEMDDVEVRIYDHADPTPRPIVGQASGALAGVGLGAPREVALCLSFFADRNLPRNRGRIYVGPLRANIANAPRPSLVNQQLVLDLAQDFASLGGIDVDWAVWSRTDNVFRHITDAWVDDSWDTIRSRGQAPESRLTSSSLQ